MAVDITIGGTPYWSASTYSVAEDSTPIDPSDTSGGTGQIQASLLETPTSKLWRRKELLLSDGSQGTTVGRINSVSGDGMVAQIVADSRMNVLNVTRTAQPYSGTLAGAIRYYFGLAGLTDDIIIDSTIADRTVVMAGWSAVVWDRIKALCAAQQIETSLVSNRVVVRPIRGRIAVSYRDSQVNWGLDDSNIAQSVEIYYHRGEKRTDLAYPLGGWTKDVQAYQVDAGDTVTFDIPLLPSDDEGASTLGASLSDIMQPNCVASVSKNYRAGSVYSVSGNDGLPITPAQWTAGGGSVTAAINKDTTSITVTVTGMSDSKYSPFTIGMSSGDNTYYSSLRLRGTGVFTDRGKLTLRTGHDEDRAPTEVGATVDSPFIRSYEDAWRAGMWALTNWTGPKRTISVSTSGINRSGDTGSEAQLTMGEFNKLTAYAGIRASQFNTLERGTTVGQLSLRLRGPVLERFESQAFGNVAGARVLYDNSYFRIRSVTALTPESVSYSAESDDTMGDFNTIYRRISANEFNAIHAGKMAGDLNVQPMADRATITRYTLTPSETLFPSETLIVL